MIPIFFQLHDSQNSHSISISSSNPKLKHNQNPDLNDESLIIDIPDALSEKDGVKFTIHTRTNLTQFHSRNFSVIRDHDDFIWLHDRFEENANYAGFIVSVFIFYLRNSKIFAETSPLLPIILLVQC